MPTRKNKPGAGRPLKEIDQKQFEKLCGIQCTKSEMCAFFDCSEDTIERWCNRTYGRKFAEVFTEKRGVGKISLRHAQWQMAQNNPTMAIFLGKNYLGQSNQDRDSTETDLLSRATALLEAVQFGTNRKTD